jgi:hypothetical protein
MGASLHGPSISDHGERDLDFRRQVCSHLLDLQWMLRLRRREDADQGAWQSCEPLFIHEHALGLQQVLVRVRQRYFCAQVRHP